MKHPMNQLAVLPRTPRPHLLACAVLALLSLGTTAAQAQAGCGPAMPDFQAALKSGTAEALSAYLDKHAPCFEAPARARLQALGGTAEPEPVAEAETLPDVAPDIEPEVSSCEANVNARSQNSNVSVNVQFVNQTGIPLAVNWINYEGQSQNYGMLEPGQTFHQQTYLTHPWEFAGPGGECVAIILPDANKEQYEIRN